MHMKECHLDAWTWGLRDSDSCPCARLCLRGRGRARMHAHTQAPPTWIIVMDGKGKTDQELQAESELTGRICSKDSPGVCFQVRRICPLSASTSHFKDQLSGAASMFPALPALAVEAQCCQCRIDPCVRITGLPAYLCQVALVTSPQPRGSRRLLVCALLLLPATSARTGGRRVFLRAAPQAQDRNGGGTSSMHRPLRRHLLESFQAKLVLLRKLTTVALKSGM